MWLCVNPGAAAIVDLPEGGLGTCPSCLRALQCQCCHCYRDPRSRGASLEFAAQLRQELGQEVALTKTVCALGEKGVP